MQPPGGTGRASRGVAAHCHLLPTQSMAPIPTADSISRPGPADPLHRDAVRGAGRPFEMTTPYTGDLRATTRTICGSIEWLAIGWRVADHQISADRMIAPASSFGDLRRMSWLRPPMTHPAPVADMPNISSGGRQAKMSRLSTAPGAACCAPTRSMR